MRFLDYFFALLGVLDTFVGEVEDSRKTTVCAMSASE